LFSDELLPLYDVQPPFHGLGERDPDEFSSWRKKKSKKIFHPVILKVTPHKWVHARNSILASAVTALANEKSHPFHKAVTVDQLYSLVQPSFISPLMFASNLFAYTLTRSKLNANKRLEAAHAYDRS